ncbi:hypothetical protein NEUTE2DRAFT_168592 [Neurospora tetrasperma FGSC 2509]|nr:hypothetical protein NEUTE2DRAFT_168592 [Neurospora tetrasperma FGSC 2509]
MSGNVQKSAMSTKQPEHRPRHRKSEHYELPRGPKAKPGIIRGPVKKEQVTERAP